MTRSAWRVWAGLTLCLGGCGVRVPVEDPKPQRAVAAPVQSEAKPGKAVPAAPGPAQAAAGFPFPRDRAGKLVAATLQPAEKGFAWRSAERRPWRGPRHLEHPEVTLPPYRGDVVRLSPAVARGAVRPAALPEGPPLAHEQTDARPPEDLRLPAPALARLPAPNVEEPPPLPFLSGAQPDRPALTDPTGPASIDATLAGVVPVRTTPAPFERLNIPDPFEHYQTARLRLPPPETPPAPQQLPRTPPKSLPEKTP